MRFSIKNRVLDFLVITLNICHNMSMISVWVLTPIGLSSSTSLFIVTFLLFFFRFGAKVKFPPNSSNGIIFLFSTIYVFDIIQAILYERTIGVILDRFILLFDMLLFILYVYNIFVESKSSNNRIGAITWSYEVYSIYNIITVILCATLIFLGVISESSNVLPVNRITIQKENIGEIVTFPGYLSLCLSNTLRGLSSFNIPVLTGLSQEPHILCYLLGPAFFILLYRLRDNGREMILLYVFYVIVLVVSTSVTGITMFFIILLFEIFYSIKTNNNRKRNVIVLSAVLIAVTVFFVNNRDVTDSITELFLYKFDSESSSTSLNTSQSMLQYMLSPVDVLGMGNIPSAWGENSLNDNVGMMTSFLDVIFLAYLFVQAIKNVFSKNIMVHYVGLSCLYAFLHSLKLGVQMFSFPYLSFFVALTIINNQLCKSGDLKIIQ